MDEIDSIADIVQLVKDGFMDWKRFGYVTVRKQGDLLIFNYNTMAQYAENWTYFERVSRGLIINHQTGEIVARGFDKFFNWNEHGERQHYTTAPLEYVMEKMDGSLGVLYRLDSEYKIATRGSFEGPQALWATSYLQSNYNLKNLPDELTLLFEIIYPENRVVVDYGNREDLVLLAARNRFTGDYISLSELRKLAETYHLTLPKIYTFDSVDAVIQSAQLLDATAEGYVGVFADGQRFKFKSLRYLELHKMIVTLTFKTVLKAMEANTVEQVLAPIPDEFLKDARDWIAEIENVLQTKKQEVIHIFKQAPKDSRKDFALWVQQYHRDKRQYLFAMLDEKPIEPLIFKHHNWGHDEEDES